MEIKSLPDNPYLLLTPGPLSTTKTVKAAKVEAGASRNNRIARRFMGIPLLLELWDRIPIGSLRRHDSNRVPQEIMRYACLKFVERLTGCKR
ncbi:MAG: hypothetical protein AAB112_03420, partial [Thermodesulfobacteriota bacterium]